jgi:pyruvate/2-oxoglutarate dehydrogenase complex dihydrolipoamide acyltransferase (E2) component
MRCPVAEPIAISIPRDSVNDDSAKILAWKAPSGSSVVMDQLICEVETSKAVLEIHAPESGVLVYSAAEGAEIPVGATICTIFPAGMETEAGPQSSLERTAGEGAARLSAAARTTAAELGIDVSSFPACMLVRQKDVLRKAGKVAQSASEPATAGMPIRWEDLPRRKELEGRMLQHGRALTVQSSVTATCRAEPSPTRLPAIIYEAARLLRKYPMFNAAYEDGKIGYYEQVNIGWALDGGQGLVVPVIPETDGKSVQQITEFLDRQLEAYLEGALTTAELAGATFTVTDLSGQGISFFDPLIVAGQSAILGISQGSAEDLLHLTLAFDHQVTEGKKAAEFLQGLCGRLEARAAVTQAEQPEPYCMVCHRDGNTLQRRKLVLLKSEVPPGLICSLCLAGW